LREGMNDTTKIIRANIDAIFSVITIQENKLLKFQPETKKLLRIFSWC